MTFLKSSPSMDACCCKSCGRLECRLYLGTIFYRNRKLCSTLYYGVPFGLSMSIAVGDDVETAYGIDTKDAECLVDLYMASVCCWCRPIISFCLCLQRRRYYYLLTQRYVLVAMLFLNDTISSLFLATTNQQRNSWKGSSCYLDSMGRRRHWNIVDSHHHHMRHHHSTTE